MANVAITKWPGLLPNPAQAGDTLIAACYWHGSGATTTTLSVSDDKSNTWTLSPTQASDGTNSTVLQIAYAQNVTANTQKITPLLNGGQSMQCGFWEYAGVSTASGTSNLDGNHCNIPTSGTTLSAGSFTTGTAGDLIFFAATVDNFTTVPTSPVSFTIGSGFSYTGVEDGTGLFWSEYEVQSSAGAINASGTLSVAQQGGPGCAIAFKAAAAGGSVPSTGIYVNGAVIQSYGNAGSGGGGQINWTGSSITLQFPIQGTAIFLVIEGATNTKPTSISSTPSLTWTAISDGGATLSGGCSDNAGNAFSICGWYATGASPGNLSITIPYAVAPSVSPVTELIDLSNPNASFFDVAKGATGNLAAQTGTAVGPSITPAGANELIIAAIEQDGQVVSAVNHGYLMTIQSDGYQNVFLDQDGGWSHWYNPPVSSDAVTFTYSNTEGAVNVGNWETFAAALRGTTAVGGSAGFNKRAKLERLDP